MTPVSAAAMSLTIVFTGSVSVFGIDEPEPEEFVHVALGDSYSSGEGARPFEDGTNYPLNQPPDSTLTDRFGGDSCHRSLVNYAKLNFGLLEQGTPPILVDRTCSGALIEPDAIASKAPMAGDLATDENGELREGQMDPVAAAAIDNAGNETTQVVEFIVFSPPTAIDDNATVTTGSTIDVAVLDNDLDAASDINPATLTIIEQPSIGTATVIADGTISYEAGPTAGETAVTYQVADSDGFAAQAVLRIIITPAETGGCTITGTPGDDVLYGTDGDDVICGRGGDDIIHALGGADTVLSGPGHDIIYAGDGDDTIHGGSGNDVIHAEEGDDTINGERGKDELHGGAGDDILRGGDGFDILNGDAGNDLLSGGNGPDVLSGGNGNDTLKGGRGPDSLWGGDGTDILRGNAGFDRMFGGLGDDVIRGGLGLDAAFGGAGIDACRVELGVSCETTPS